MTPWKYIALTGRRPPLRLFGLGLGASLIGGLVMFGLRYFARPPTTARIPANSAAAPLFRSRVFASSRGQMLYHESVLFPEIEAAASGHAPPLVFVHDLGVGVSSYEWSKVAASFAGPHRVLVPDLIGFGESERPHIALRAADHVAALADFLRHILHGGSAAEETLDPARGAVLVASGGGAALCAQLATEQPALVRRLVLLAPRGRGGSAWWRRAADRVPNLGRYLYRNLAARRKTLRKHLQTAAFANPARVTDEVVEVFTLCAQQYLAGVAVRAWWTGKLDVDLENAFSRLAAPIILLLPAGATVQDKNTAARLAALNPRAGPARMIPEAGPLFAALEVPEIVAQILALELAAEKNAQAAPVSVA